MSKAIGITIIALLVLLIASILLTWWIPSPVSAECRQATERAAAYNFENLYAAYETDAYDRAENINQQQFIAAEYAFVMLQAIAAQNRAILACR